MASLALMLLLSFAEYQLRQTAERTLVESRLHKYEMLLTNAVNDGISASKTLGYIAQNQPDFLNNFQAIGKQILESNPYVDAIQYLNNGTIVAVFPIKENESVIGYNVLEDPNTRREVEEAIRRKDIYFSGPINLRQGGSGIVGRYPLFEEGQLVGISAVIIHFERLLQLAGLNHQQDPNYFYQLSKVNPNTGKLEAFLTKTDTEEYTGHLANKFMEIGNWSITVQLKESTVLNGLILELFLRFTGSILLGLLVWSFARQPIVLRKKVAIQSQEILQANERFELASKATTDIIWDWDLITNQVYRSDQFQNVLGYQANSETNSSHFWESIIHPEDIESVRKVLYKTLDSTNQYWDQEFRVKKFDGTYAYVLDKGFIVRNSEGKVIRVIGATRDISVRKASELELIEVNQRLSRANEELKAFASLASHDLREPLRMISSFMSLLEKKYGESLDEKANQYISFAVDGAKRLTTLIKDLLEYSQVGFDPSLIEEINTQELVHNVLKLKSNLLREHGAVVNVEELPRFNGIKTPIQMLFQNLIGNALKYRKPDVAPKITVAAQEMKDYWEFSVKDNGIGIEAEYHDLIFGFSKKLHSKEIYAGNGMGLATCKKIITQHGGKIWVESNPGTGSEFKFTIKKNISQNVQIPVRERQHRRQNSTSKSLA